MVPKLCTTTFTVFPFKFGSLSIPANASNDNDATGNANGTKRLEVHSWFDFGRIATHVAF